MSVLVKLDTRKLMESARNRGYTAELLCHLVKRSDLVDVLKSGEVVEVPYPIAMGFVTRVTAEGQEVILQDFTV